MGRNGKGMKGIGVLKKRWEWAGWEADLMFWYLFILNAAERQDF